MRDETDLSGLKLTIDLKRGTDPAMLMLKLFRMTPLQDSVSCNFNILVSGMPRVMGVREILQEWVAWRTDCVRRRVFHELGKKKDKLHLLRGLERILLDIDKAIAIIRETEREAEVVPNLMIGFGIDEIQADYVAEIRLRNINREYIVKRIQEIADLLRDIDDLEDILDRKARVSKIITDELAKVMQEYGAERRSGIVYANEVTSYEEETEVADYPVTLFLSREGYFKKITPQSLRMSSEQKYKEGDGPGQQMEASNRDELLVFTNQCQVYKTRVSEFDDTKASVLGTYLPTELGMDDGEHVIYVHIPGDYKGNLLFFFANGKVARVETSAYETKTNRKKLTGAYSDLSPVMTILPLREEIDVVAYSTEGRAILFNTSLLNPKSSRNTQGVGLMTLKKAKYQLKEAKPLTETQIRNTARYRARSIPVAGAQLLEEDQEEQQLGLLGDSVDA